jgi:hypothetical protein
LGSCLLKNIIMVTIFHFNLQIKSSGFYGTDSIHISLLTTINNYIPLLALFASAIAIYISYKAYKKTERVSHPKVFQREIHSDKYYIYIADYSVGKNLNVEYVLYKGFNKHKYFEVNFNQEYLAEYNPPKVKLKIKGEVGESIGKLRIETNYGKLYEYVNPLYPKVNIDKLRFIQRLRYKRHKRKYDTQFPYPLE